MIEFTSKEIFFIIATIISVVYNILQYKHIKTTQKEKFTPIFNGLIGLFNDIKLKISKYYLKQNLMYSPKNPYQDIEALRWNFYEFTIEAISHLDSLRESIVPVIKSIDENEDRIFKGADFGLTIEEKNQKKLFIEKSRIDQEILKIKKEAELGKLKEKGK